MKIEYQRKLLLFGNQSRWTAGESGWLDNRLAGNPPQWTTTLPSVLGFTCPRLTHFNPAPGYAGWQGGWSQLHPDPSRSRSSSHPDIFLSSKDKEGIWRESKVKERREEEAEHHRLRPVAPLSPTRFHLSSYDRDGDGLNGAGPRVKRVFHQQLRQ